MKLDFYHPAGVRISWIIVTIAPKCYTGYELLILITFKLFLNLKLNNLNIKLMLTIKKMV